MTNIHFLLLQASPNKVSSDEEVSYEDDFESYESDFDSYHSSSPSEQNGSDETGDKDDEGNDDDDESEAVETLKEVKDEENMLDSGKFYKYKNIQLFYSLKDNF